ncbi:MAG: lipoyl(octanoyl) transferase LipB [Pseudomonadales bacterium]|nr:lipoyl(octanoyl) transferase LipB [Pseudomonadales bacterium]NRA15329.1 lipoyl(octanoyl) transferase LipB [Oceanospirillaceae bacterium]
MAAESHLIIRRLGLQPYQPTWRKMQQLTNQRDKDSSDEIWLLEHQSVFTQGQAGRAEHLLNPGDIPVVQVDRGGQVTYHGPGQLIMYLMLDLRRNKLGVRDIVTLMEQGIIDLLQHYDVHAYAKADAPGVYVDQSKIASLGLRVRRGCSFHGLALNLNVNTEPFLRINPCGYAGMKMSNLSDYVSDLDNQQAATLLADYMIKKIGYENISYVTEFN